jgi:Uma2 family endonuclease
MSATLRKPMTLAEFLDWEERQVLRYEFDGIQPVGMTGGTVAHDQITFNIRSALAARLAGTPCRPLGPNVKIIADGHVYYPDAFVTCRPVPSTATVADDPVTVFEVTSEGSYQTDLIVKNRSYRATPSIQRYVILQQAQKAAIVFARRGQDWLAEIVSGDDAVLSLPELGIEVPLDALYVGIVLEPLPDEGG